MSLLNRLMGKEDETKTKPAAPAPDVERQEKQMPAPTVEGVFEAIRKNVYDPEIGLNIVDLGLVYDVKVTDDKIVDVEMTLTSPGCPVGPQIIRGVQTYVHNTYPDLDAINVHIVWTPMWGPERMTQEAKDQLGFF